MLMMTFSPISTRPSIVAEPMCGSTTTLPARASLRSLGLTAGACHRLDDRAHADDAEPLAPDAVADHPGWRPAVPLAMLEHLEALGEPPRHCENERHGHVGSVLGEDARRVSDHDAARVRRLDV